MTTKLHFPALFAVLALHWAPPVSAQEPEDPIEAEQWKNGFLPTGTYAGPNVSVNLYNGNVIASIPLVSLPGRAGHDLNLTLSYNSRQLVRHFDEGYWMARWFNDGPPPSDFGEPDRHRQDLV